MNNWIAEEMARAQIRRKNRRIAEEVSQAEINHLSRIEPDKGYEEIIADTIYECGIEPDDCAERVLELLDDLHKNGWDITRREDG